MVLLWGLRLAPFNGLVYHMVITKVVGSSLVKTRKILDFDTGYIYIYLCIPLCFLLIAAFLCVHKIYGYDEYHIQVHRYEETTQWL